MFRRNARVLIEFNIFYICVFMKIDTVFLARGEIILMTQCRCDSDSDDELPIAGEQARGALRTGRPAGFR